MLVIRDAQMRVFRAHLEDSFRRRLRDHLQDTLSDASRFTAEELDREIQSAIDQAVDCGITKEAEIAMFVEVIFRQLNGFPENGLPKEVLPALYAYGVDPAVKIGRFIEWCAARNVEVEA